MFSIPLAGLAGLDNDLIENILTLKSLKGMVNQSFPYILSLLRSLILSLYSHSVQQYFFELGISQAEIVGSSTIYEPRTMTLS
jgi:hypothetical protein